MYGERTDLIEDKVIWEENETNNLKDKKKKNQSKLEEIEN